MQGCCRLTKALGLLSVTIAALNGSHVRETAKKRSATSPSPRTRRSLYPAKPSATMTAMHAMPNSNAKASALKGRIPKFRDDAGKNPYNIPLGLKPMVTVFH